MVNFDFINFEIIILLVIVHIIKHKTVSTFMIKFLDLGDLYAFLNHIEHYIKSPMQKAPSYIFDWVQKTPLILTT